MRQQLVPTELAPQWWTSPPNADAPHVPHEAWEHAAPEEPRGAEAQGDGRQMM